MRKWRERMEALSLSKKVAAAMLLTPILSSLIILIFYYGYMRQFYREKVTIFQENNRQAMAVNLRNISKQMDYVSSQLLGMAVLDEDFGGYSQKTPYEKLVLNREVNAQLINICISNEFIDNIYMMDFEGNSYTSNGKWDQKSYLEEMDVEIHKDQEGRSEILPPHPANYRYLGSTSSDVYMVSLVIYLNRYTKSGAIGLIQIDIPYEKVRKAVELLEMTEEDFSFIVDGKKRLIYAPNKEDVGKEIEKVTFGTYSLGEVWRQAQKEASGTAVVSVPLEMGDWTLVQVNSDSMLQEELGKMQNTWSLIFLICLLCAVGCSLSLSQSITRPITNLIRSMGKVGKGNFNIQVEQPGNRELAALVCSFNSMIQEVDSLMKENIQKEHEKTRVQMMALNAKINSHFLYNTLNTIKWQAITLKQMDIANSIVALTKILEYSYKNSPDLVPMKDEIAFIQDYIFIQNIRYGSHVSVEYDLEEDSRECLVLKMLLQPIVENALLHGFQSREGRNVIVLQCRKVQECMEVCIFDNGKGFVYEGFDKLTGIGLNNVKERLELYFGEKGRLELSSVVGQGTHVTLWFPIIREKGEEIDETTADRR